MGAGVTQWCSDLEGVIGRSHIHRRHRADGMHGDLSM